VAAKDRFKRSFAALLLAMLFVTQLLLAALVHLNTAVARHALERWTSSIVSGELRGRVAIGHIERLGLSNLWLQQITLYDEQQRPVAAIDRVRVSSTLWPALRRWATSQESLTLVIESIRAEGVHLYLRPAPNDERPSLLVALEPAPAKAKTADEAPGPYRIFLSNIELGEVIVDNELPNFDVGVARLQKLSGQLLLTDQGVAASLKRFSLDLASPSVLPLHVFGNLEYRSPSRLWGDVQATLGHIPISARIQYDHETLASVISAYRVTPEAIRELNPNWPILRPLTVSLKTNGPLHQLAVRLELDAGTTHAEAAGTVALLNAKRADIAFEAHGIDFQALLGQALPSDLDVAARIALVWVDEEPRISIDGVLQPGQFLRFRTPRIDLQGNYDADGFVVSGRSSDPTLPIRAAAILRNHELDVEAQVEGVKLAPLVAGMTSARVSGLASAQARAKFTSDAIAATVDLTLRDLRIGSVKLAQAKVSTNFEGPLSRPQTWTGELSVDAKRIVAPYTLFERLVLRAQGSPERANLTLSAEQPGVAKIRINAEALPFEGPKLNHAHLDLTRGTSCLSLHAATIQYSDNALVLDSVALEGGAGQAQGSLTIQSGQIFGRLLGQSIDLGVVSELIGLPSHSLAGHANLEFDIDTRQRPSTGLLRVTLERATLGLLTNVTGTLEAGLDADRLTGVAELKADLIDDVRANLDLELAGAPARLSSYQEARGNASLELNRVRLDRLGTLLGLFGNGAAVSGTANIRLTGERSAATGLPDLTLSAVTNQLSVTAPYASSRIQLNNEELLLSVGYTGATGQLQSDWVLSRWGQPKANFQFLTNLSAQERSLDDTWAIVRDWPNLPFEAMLRLPRQSISELGTVLGSTFGSGSTELKLWLKGPIRLAHVVTELQGNDLILEPLGNALPFDVQGLLEYTRGSGDARVLLAAGSPTKTWLQVNGVASLPACAGSIACIGDWTGNIEVGLLGLPLEALPVLGPLGFSGEVRGVLSAQRHDGVTQVTGVVPVDNVHVAGHPLGQTLLSVRSDRDQLTGAAKLIDGSAQIDFEAQIPIDWRPAVPRRRRGAPIRLAAKATGYDAGFLTPWLKDYVTDLAGELNGNLEATYTSAEASGVEQPAPQLALGGRMALRGGKATLRAFDLTLGDVTLTAQASSTAKRTTIAIPNFSASVGDESNNLAGAAVIELEQFTLKRLAATIERAKNVPFVANSVTLATLSGGANVEVTPVPKGFDVGIEVSQLELRLPRFSGREVLGLTENPDIVVVQPLGPDAWRMRHATNSSTYRVRLSLGNKSKVTRSDLNLPISGTPEITIGKRTSPSGTIQLLQMGRLELFGKAFVVERGTLTLDPDQPTNPRLDVVATWRGPTHVVQVQILGKRNEARLRLTSDPPLASESQVMALLLGGGGNDSTASAGLGVGATLFNELLSDTALSSLEVRTSSDERHANYTAAVPLRDNLWFEATYQSPTNTSLPGSSAQKGFSGTVDYRFHRDWSVRSELGTLGAGADLMWQYRY